MPGISTDRGSRTRRYLSSGLLAVALMTGCQESESPQEPTIINASHVPAHTEHPPGVVQSLNDLSGDVRLVAGPNVFIFPNDTTGTITIGSPSTSVFIVRQINTIPPGLLNAAIALSCPPGSKVVSGGFNFASHGGNVFSSFPSVSPTFGERWVVRAANPTASPLGLDVFAVCLS
jgi:hypothetical protein